MGWTTDLLASALPNSFAVIVRFTKAKRWVSSINLVNAAGLRPQDSAFVGLSNFPSFDRNHAGKERTHLAIPGADRVFELTDYTRGTGKTFSAKIVIKSSLGGDRFVGV